MKGIMAVLALVTALSLTTIDSKQTAPATSVAHNDGSDDGCCPDGWIYYRGSCYFIGRELRTWTEARALCGSHGGDLWVVNDLKEWDIIRQFTIRYHWAWIGLVWKIDKPGWEPHQDGVNTELMPWLTKTYDAAHGHAPGIDCAGFYPQPDANFVYVHWYDCRTRYYFVCERNTTFTKTTVATTVATTTPRPKPIKTTTDDPDP